MRIELNRFSYQGNKYQETPNASRWYCVKNPFMPETIPPGMEDPDIVGSIFDELNEFAEKELEIIEVNVENIIRQEFDDLFSDPVCVTYDGRSNGWLVVSFETEKELDEGTLAAIDTWIQKRWNRLPELITEYLNTKYEQKHGED